MSLAYPDVPEDLFAEIKRLSPQVGVPVDEVIREAVQLALQRLQSLQVHPGAQETQGAWTLPTFDGGHPLVPSEQLKEIAYEAEASRPLTR